MKDISLNRIFRFLLFLFCIYAMQHIGYKVNLEKSTSTTGMKIANDTYEDLEKMAIGLNAQSFNKGQVRYAEQYRWTHVDGSFLLKECIDYYDLEKIIVQTTGFKKMEGGSFFCKGDVVFHIIHASRYERGLLCDKIYFDYSWEANENSEKRICWEKFSQPHIKKQPALQLLNVQAAFVGNG